MNFTLLFPLISTLSFVVEFPVDTTNKQDYIYFEGVNQTAHLFRDNYILTLYLNRGSNYSLYNAEINHGYFSFSWSGFRVNDVAMTVMKSIGSIDDINFDQFTFISPIFDVILNEPETEYVYRLHDNVNYWYILLIVFAVSVLFESKTKGLGVAKKLAILVKAKAADDPFTEISEGEEESSL